MSSIELLVLSCLAHRASHGYRLWADIAGEGVLLWQKVGFSSIYNVMKKLERKGLIRGTIEQKGQGPPMRTFSITESGRGALREALESSLAESPRLSSPLQLLLANQRNLASDELRTLMATYLRSLERGIQEVEQKRGALRKGGADGLFEGVFSHLLALLNAERVFIERYIADEKPTIGIRDPSSLSNRP